VKAETSTDQGNLTQLPLVWNQPVDPATHPGALSRPVRPTTWEDLGGKNVVHTSALRGFQVKSDAEGRRYVVNFEETLDLYTKVYEFGDAISPNWGFAWTENYRELVDEISRRGLILHHCAGYLPGPESKRVPLEAHHYVLDKLGRRFTGWDNGEHDCRYTLGAVDEYPFPESPTEAFAQFMDYEWKIAEDLRHYFSTLSNNTFQHYLADIADTRMVGCQVAQSKPSVPMWFAMLRGSGKQYGLLWWAAPSEWNRWGAKDYTGKIGYTPYDGTSLSLLRRLWFLAYMYGSAVIMSEYAILNSKVTKTVVIDGREREVPTPTPVGEQHLEIAEWFRKHPNRGVMYTPVALIWDFYAGFIPGRRVPADSRPYHSWGRIPFEKGHHQIDAVFRMLYPGYEDSGYYRDERGFLPPTPCGDIFDVLLSNVPRFVLNRYNAAVVIGPTKIDGQLLQTLECFIQQGGWVATTASQLTPESAEMFGVRLTGETFEERYSTIVGGIGLNEPVFTRHGVEPMPGTDVLVTNYYGDPLVLRRKTEMGGDLLVFASDYGLSDPVTDPPVGTQSEVPLPPVHLLLQHVQSVLIPWLGRWNIVEIDGGPVQYLTNLTDRPDCFIVTVCNNAPYKWTGTLRFRGANIAGGSNWMTDGRIDPADSIRIELGPHEIATLELYSDRPLVAFKDSDGPPPTDQELMRHSDAIFAKLAKNV